jgi:hypothetical protein
METFALPVTTSERMTPSDEITSIAFERGQELRNKGKVVNIVGVPRN